VKNSPAKQILYLAIPLQCDIPMKKKERWVVFREEKAFVSIIDKVADVKGINRSDFIREAIRKHLAELGFLSEKQKRVLGTKKTSQNLEGVCE
jgi:hypothetical protein